MMMVVAKRMTDVDELVVVRIQRCDEDALVHVPH